MSLPTVYLLCPDPDAFISGGNLYNKRVIEAAHSVKPIYQMDLDAFFNGIIPDQTIFLIDSIYFSDLEKIFSRMPFSCKSGLLVHYLPFLDPTSNSKVNEKNKKALRQFDFFITPSNFMKGQLETINISPTKVGVLPPLVKPVASDYIPPSSTSQLLIIANLLPVKGILEFLLELKTYLSKQGDYTDFDLKIVGSSTMNPEYAKDCLKLADDPMLTKIITILPPMEPNKISNLLVGQDMLLSVAKFESFGMAVWEAMCCGIPVLALSRGNLPPLLKSYKGGMLKPNLKSLIEELFDITSDTGKIKGLKKSAYIDRKQNQWKPENIVRRFYQLIPSFKTGNSWQEDNP